MRNWVLTCSVLSILAASAAQAKSTIETESELNLGRHLHLIREPSVPSVLDLTPGVNGSDEEGDLRASSSSKTVAKPAAKAASQAVTFHGGRVLNHVSVRTLFAGPKWATAAFAADKLTGLDSFFKGYSGSSYAGSVDEYIGSNGEVGFTLNYQGYRAPSAKSSSVDGGNMSTVVSAVCNEIASGSFPVDTSGSQLVVVYTDKPRPASASYCGFHGAVSCRGQTIQYAFLWNLDGDASCSAQDATTGHSEGLAAVANVSAHEVGELRTDPQLNAWYDNTGAEVADKCAWNFPHSSVPFKNGTKWKVQSMWSNYAYIMQSGHASPSGTLACVDGN
jgi:hypothetical protein